MTTITGTKIELPLATAPTYFTDKHAQSMTLRDHFAGLAMQGYLAADPTFECDLHEVADMAYEQADAMLEAREA